MGFPLVEIEHRGCGVWLLRMNRAEVRNALSIELRDELSGAVEVIGARDDVGAIVLSGAGTTFSAGFDLAEFDQANADPELDARLWASSDRFHHSIMRCRVPMICALNGPALAGGFDLATLCDLRVAQPGVWFARPEVDFGVPLFEPLRELVGGALARELCLSSRRVELDEAVRIGLVNRVAPPGGSLDESLRLATEIASRPHHVLRATKSKFVSATGLAARPTLTL